MVVDVDVAVAVLAPEMEKVPMFGVSRCIV